MQWWEVHVSTINKGFMLHVIPNNHKLFSGKPNSFSIVIGIIKLSILKTQKTHMLCVTQL